MRFDDTLSIQENVGHLLILEPLWFGRVNDILDGKERLRETDLSNQSSFDANFNEMDIDTLITMFDEARIKLIDQLIALPSTVVDQTAHHPRLEIPMRIVDVAYFVAEHDDYHLARISELHRVFTND